MVKIYTTPGCVRCEEMKSYMKNSHISFEETEITDFFEIDRKSMSQLVANGYDEASTEMPVLNINDHVYVGGDVQELKNIVSM